MSRMISPFLGLFAAAATQNAAMPIRLFLLLHNDIKADHSNRPELSLQ